MPNTDKLFRIKFRYADEYSNWEWRYQQCTMESVDKCIEVYGLDSCMYEILSVEEI